MPLMRAIGRFAVRYRYLVIAVWLIATLACIHFLPSLSSVSSSDTGSFLPATEPSQQAAQLAGPFQPATGSTATLIVTRGGGLTPGDEAAITQIETTIRSVAHVTTVRDQGISADGQARKALIAVDVTTSSTQAAPVVSDIRTAVSGAQLPSGLVANISGQLPTSVDNQAASQKAQQLTQALSDIAILVMLLIVYRAALAPLLNLAPAVLVLLLSERVIAQASLAGLPVSNVTQTILTVLILGAGTDYGLFLILRVREELRRGHTPHDAVIEAVAQVGESITFSGGTVIAALLCLLFAAFGIYQGLGPSLAIGVGLMLLAGLTLLPALLAVFGRATFWPLRTTAGAEKPGAWGRIAGQITQRPLVTLLLGVALFGGLSLCTLAYAPGGFAGSSTGPTGSDSATGTSALQAHYPAAVVNPTAVVLTFPTSMWGNLAPLAQAEQQLGAASQFQAVSGPFNPNGHAITPAQLQMLYAKLGAPSLLPPIQPASVHLPAATYNLYRAESQFLSADGRTVQFYTTLAAGDPTSTAALQAIPSVRSVVSSVAQSVGANASGVRGQAAVAYDVSAVSDGDLVRLVPIVLVLIALLLALVMRSLVAPLYLVVSVALSYGASLGLAVLIFMVIGGASGLNFVLPFLMFVFLMALGEDYNILVMSRIREEAQQHALHDAIKLALNATGTTVTSAGLILAATFGIAGLAATTDQLRQLGVSIAIGVLLDTFLVRTLLVPSVVALLGRWNWWPSRLARTTHPAAAQAVSVAEESPALPH